MHHTPSPALPLSPPSPVQNYAEIGYQEEMCPRGMYMYCRICCLWSDGPLCFMKLLCITGASQHTVLFDFGTDYVTERLLSDGWSEDLTCTQNPLSRPLQSLTGQLPCRRTLWKSEGGWAGNSFRGDYGAYQCHWQCQCQSSGIIDMNVDRHRDSSMMYIEAIFCGGALDSNVECICGL